MIVSHITAVVFATLLLMGSLGYRLSLRRDDTAIVDLADGLLVGSSIYLVAELVLLVR